MKARILIACEYSGIVANAFASSGFNVTSCDLLDNEHPSSDLWTHYKGDVRDLLSPGSFDATIGFPSCQYLCKAQQWRYKHEEGRSEKATDAIKFFDLLYNSSPIVCLENPPGLLSKAYKAPSQTIYPWQFGDPYSKPINLWLKGLPVLLPTLINLRRKSVSNHVNGRMSQAQKSKIRSRFFVGVAAAMANQWKSFLSLDPNAQINH